MVEHAYYYQIYNYTAYAGDFQYHQKSWLHRFYKEGTPCPQAPGDVAA